MTPSTKATPRLECPSCRVHPHREPCSRNCAITRNDTLLAENQRLRAALEKIRDMGHTEDTCSAIFSPDEACDCCVDIAATALKEGE